MSGLRLLARVELRRSWATMVVLGLLAGIGAGIALASVQVARRSSTAYERLEAASGAPDAIVLGIASGVDDDDLARLPEVDRIWSGRTGVGQVLGDRLNFLGVIAGNDAPPRGSRGRGAARSARARGCAGCRPCARGRRARRAGRNPGPA